MDNGRTFNLKLLLTTALTGSLLFASPSNAEVLRRAPAKPSIEINFSAISNLRGSEEFSIYKKIEADEPQLTQEENIEEKSVLVEAEQKQKVLPLVVKKEVKKIEPVVIQAELPKKLEEKTEPRSVISKNLVTPQKRPYIKNNEKQTSHKKILPVEREKEKVELVEENTFVPSKIEAPIISSKEDKLEQPIDIMKSSKQPLLEVGSLEESNVVEPKNVKKAVDVPLDKLEEFVGGKKKNEEIETATNKTEEVEGEEDSSVASFFGKISQIFKNEDEEEDLIESEELKPRENIAGVELEELKVDNLEEEGEEAEEELAEGGLVEKEPEAESEPLKELIESEGDKLANVVKEPVIVPDFDSDVQIILPNRIDKNETLVGTPSPRLRPFDAAENEVGENSLPELLEENKAEPAIPEPVDVVDVERGPSISVANKEIDEIDETTWEKILRKAKAKATNLDSVEDNSVDEKSELAKKLESIKASASLETDNKIEEKTSEIATIENSEEQPESSVLESMMKWMPAFKSKKSDDPEVEEIPAPDLAIVENKELEEAKIVEDQLVAVAKNNEKEGESKNLEFYSVNDELTSISPVADAFNNIIDDEPVNKELPVEITENVEEPEIPPLDMEMVTKAIETSKKEANKAPMAEEFELASLPQVEEVVNIPKPAKMLEPMANGALISIDFNGDEVEISSFDKDRISELVQQIKNSDKNIKIVSYAPEIQGKANSARRVSLRRAIAIRANMIEAGLDGVRINVQAVGNSAENSSEENSINIFLVNKES